MGFYGTNTGNVTAIDKMLDFEKTYLNIKARDAIDILEDMPGSKCREPIKKGMSTLRHSISLVHSFFILTQRLLSICSKQFLRETFVMH